MVRLECVRNLFAGRFNKKAFTLASRSVLENFCSVIARSRATVPALNILEKMSKRSGESANSKVRGFQKRSPMNNS